MRVAVLLGSDFAAARDAVKALCGMPEVSLVGVLLDVAQPSTRQRWKHLERNTKREGAGYLLTRATEILLEIADRISASAVPQSQVDALLHRAFPDEAFSLDELAGKLHFPVLRVTNLNSPEAAQTLAALNAELGVVLGARILKRSTFAVPRLGSINVHKGKVPEFRGMPPAFWEVFEGQTCCGVTIHFVNDGLDTGDILNEAEIPIHPQDRPETLLHRLDGLSVRLLTETLRSIAAGSITARVQSKSAAKTRTRPTRKQIAQLASRAPHLSVLKPRTGRQLLKTALYLVIWKSGLLALRRNLRRRSRAAILLYHRVDDCAADALTTSRRRFAEHLVYLRQHYEVRSTAWLVEALQRGDRIPPRTVIIHFDDCYASVAEAAAPILRAAGFPAMSFISSGFIDTDRMFVHDEIYPSRFANMTGAQVQSLPGSGVEVGSHTVHHVNLGAATEVEARYEMKTSKMDLERCVGVPVPHFSFPYGRRSNFRPEYVELARECGYEAVFSAYGGFVRANSNLYDLPRFGVADSHRPLDLMMDLEGLGFGSLKDAIQSLRKR